MGAHRRVRGGPTLVVALVLGLTGCGGDPSSPKADGTPKANTFYVKAELVKLYVGQTPGARALKSAQCMASKVLAHTSPQQLQDAGVLDDHFRVPKKRPFLPDALATTVAAAQYDCQDWYRADSAHAKEKHPLLDEGAYRSCLHHGLPAADVRAATVEYLTGHWKGDAIQHAAQVQLGCLPPRIRARATAAPTAS